MSLDLNIYELSTLSKNKRKAMARALKVEVKDLVDRNSYWYLSSYRNMSREYASARLRNIYEELLPKAKELALSRATNPSMLIGINTRTGHYSRVPFCSVGIKISLDSEFPRSIRPDGIDIRVRIGDISRSFTITFEELYEL